MMEQIVTSNVCTAIKQESIALYVEHPDSIDPKILASCIKLNQLPGIAVRWSCEGHYPIQGDNRSVEVVVIVYG